jgi:hypothetical protein
MMHSFRARLRGFVVLGIALAAGLSGGCFRSANESSAMRISSVDPLSEPEFDAFAARIADRLTPLAKTQAGEPAKFAAPQLVVEEEAWRPSARYFSYALMDGLSDRTGGALSFNRGAADPVQYRTMLMFGVSKTQPDRRTVEFVVTDANGSREVLRESAESLYRAKLAEVASTNASPPRSPPPSEVAAAPAPAPVAPETRRGALPPPQDESRPTRRTANRDASAAPSRHSRTAAPPRAEPRGAQTAQREDEPVAEATVAPPGDSPAAVAQPIDLRDSEKRIKPGKIKINAKSSEIGRQIEASAALYAGRTFAGEAGRVILMDENTVGYFAVAGQRVARNSRDQLQTQLTLACGRKARDAQYRVVFYDESGEPVSATPVLSVEFKRGESKRITVTAGDSRAARYVWLVQED